MGKKNDIDVSVVIPIYNLPDLVESNLDLISKQTYNKVEYIYIDNSSTSETYDQLNKLSKRHTAVSIKIIRTTIKGVANARMMGLNAASGKYIIFLDADDVYDSVLVDKYVEQIKKNETDIEFFNFFGSNTRYLDTSSLDLKTSRKLLVDVLLSKISAHSFSYISKRDIWLNSDFNNEMVVNEYLFALCNMLMRNKRLVGGLNSESFYTYVCRPNSKMNTLSWRDLDNSRYVYEKILDLMDSDAYLYRLAHIMLIKIVAGHLSRALNENNEEKISQVKQELCQLSLGYGNYKLRIYVTVLLLCSQCKNGYKVWKSIQTIKASEVINKGER